MAPQSSTLAWKIPWTEEPGGLPSMGSQSRTQLKRLSSSSSSSLLFYALYSLLGLLTRFKKKIAVHLKLTQHCKSTPLQLKHTHTHPPQNGGEGSVKERVSVQTVEKKEGERRDDECPGACGHSLQDFLSHKER